MHEWLMAVLVRVRLASIPLEGMSVLMVSIVAMGMRVSHRLVSVLVLVHLGQVQPDADGHQRRRQSERPRGRLAESDDRNRSAGERRGGEIGGGAR